MDAIIDFFTSVIGVIESAIGFLFDMIEQLINLVVMLGQAAVAIPSLFVIMPPPATIGLTAILTIAIAYKLLGRE